MKRNKCLKIAITLLLTIVGILSCNITTSADFGPKDELIVHVKNPPNELYYLDLLTEDTIKYNNFNEDERGAFNQAMLSLLYSYENEGWKPAFTEGTGVPMWGNLVGEVNGDEMTHTFGYVGVPQTYRIIIVTESGKVSVSDVYTREALQSSVTYDYNTGKTSVPQMWLSYIIQFLSTCIPTLIIEGIILILFGFKFDENWKVFILVNLVTQIILTFTLGVTFLQSGAVNAYIIHFPIEVGILIAETIIYSKFLKGKSVGSRCAYGITANITSWVVGFILLNFQFQLMFH